MSLRSDGAKDPFSVARMRGSLYLFGVGKVVAGLIGVGWLLLLVRLLDVSSYGGYVTLVALMEVTLLVTNGGVFAFAQRYVTEARLGHNLHHLPRLVWASIAYRVSTLSIAVLVFFFLADDLASALQQPQLEKVIALYGLFILFEGVARYIETVFESLLEQGFAQICTVFRNGLRLLVVSIFVVHDFEVSLLRVIQVEVACATVGVLLSFFLIARILFLARMTGGEPCFDKPFSFKRLASFAIPLYLAQCITQLYSPDAIKLVVSRMLGVAEAAAFGFAHAVSFVLNRYLPANLLLGLIRPMLVARRASAENDDQLRFAGNLILKINLFFLAPVIAFLSVSGDSLTAVLSGGKFPNSGSLLLALTLLLVFLGLHVVLSMLATAIEDRKAVLLGTVSSIPGVFIGVFLAPAAGAFAMVVGLWVSELLYCSCTWFLLKRSGFLFPIDWAGWFKLVSAAAMAALGAYFISLAFHFSVGFQISISFLVVGILYLIFCTLFRPFDSPELLAMRKLFPERFRRFL